MSVCVYPNLKYLKNRFIYLINYLSILISFVQTSMFIIYICKCFYFYSLIRNISRIKNELVFIVFVKYNMNERVV